MDNRKLIEHTLRHFWSDIEKNKSLELTNNQGELTILTTINIWEWASLTIEMA